MNIYPEKVVYEEYNKKTEFPCRNLFDVSEFVMRAHGYGWRHYGQYYRNHLRIVHIDRWGHEHIVYDVLEYGLKCLEKAQNARRA